MPRLALVNILIGFVTLFFAACAGSFISVEMTKGFVHDPMLLNSWQLTLMRSAHGHTNLFAIIHVIMGLTLPYSTLSLRVKRWQTFGLLLGTLAMSIGMMFRSWGIPNEGLDAGQVIVGVMLSCALAAMGVHAVGIGKKLVMRT